MVVSGKYGVTQALLEAAYAEYHSNFHRVRDPVSIPHEYERPEDQEITALLSALLAYGNVATILRSVREALAPLGRSPHAQLLDPAFEPRLPTFRHRFTTGTDLEILYHWIAQALRQFGSLENFFLSNTRSQSLPMRVRLSDFVQRLTQLPLPAHLKQKLPERARQLKYLLSDPERGSACKRLNLFLRWVIRPKDGIDLGLWGQLSPRELMLPVDTHLLQTLRALRWTRSQQATWLVCEAATARLRRYSPEDPVRYDFALCHLSMSGERIVNFRRKKQHAPLE